MSDKLIKQLNEKMVHNMKLLYQSIKQRLIEEVKYKQNEAIDEEKDNYYNLLEVIDNEIPSLMIGCNNIIEEHEVKHNGRVVLTTDPDRFIEENNLFFIKDDFKIKKKQKKNKDVDLCIALCADGKRCSRRKQKDEEFCGTHIKSKPFGTYNEQELKPKKTINYENILLNGIVYYRDNKNNIYDAVSILNNEPNKIGFYNEENKKLELYDI